MSISNLFSFGKCRFSSRRGKRATSKRLHAESLELREMFSVSPIASPSTSVEVVGAVVVQPSQTQATVIPGSTATPTGTSSVPVSPNPPLTFAAGGFTKPTKIIITK